MKGTQEPAIFNGKKAVSSRCSLKKSSTESAGKQPSLSIQAWRDYDGGSTRDGPLMFTVYNKIRRIILSGIVWLNLQEIVEASGFRCPNFCGYLRCHVRSGSTGSTEIPNDSVTESRAKNRSSSTVGGCAAPYGDAGGEVNELVFCPSEGSRVLTEL